MGSNLCTCGGMFFSSIKPTLKRPRQAVHSLSTYYWLALWLLCDETSRCCRTALAAPTTTTGDVSSLKSRIRQLRELKFCSVLCLCVCVCGFKSIQCNSYRLAKQRLGFLLPTILSSPCLSVLSIILINPSVCYGLRSILPIPWAL